MRTPNSIPHRFRISHPYNIDDSMAILDDYALRPSLGLVRPAAGCRMRAHCVFCALYTFAGWVGEEWAELKEEKNVKYQ